MTGEETAIASETQLLNQISLSQDEAKRLGQFEVLIMSEAGKPIYTHSKREDSVTLMPLCCSLISFAKKAQGENFATIRTSDDLIINFSTRSPLIIVLIHYAKDYLDPVILIEQIEAQVISILTAKTLRSVFEERPTYDLKKLIYGSEKLIDSILNIEPPVTRQTEWPRIDTFIPVTSHCSTMKHMNGAPKPNNDMSTNGGSTNSTTSNFLSKPHRFLIPMVAMSQNSRESIHSILSNVISSKSKNVVFSLLFKVYGYNDDKDSSQGDKETDLDSEDHTDYSTQSSSNSYNHDNNGDVNFRSCTEDICFKLMSICNHHNRHKLKLVDIHLIHALLTGTRVQLETVDFLWMPVCLPRFNEDAFLHTYMAFTNNKNHCLVIFSVDREEFSNCQQAKTIIEERLAKFEKDQKFSNYKLSPLMLVEGQNHNSQQQQNQQQQQLQFFWYQTRKQVLWWQQTQHRPMSPVLYYVMKKMFRSSLKTFWVKLSDESTFLGWHVATFQLYTQFDSSVTTNEAMEMVQRITSWIKTEEDNFCIKDYRE